MTSIGKLQSGRAPTGLRRLLRFAMPYRVPIVASLVLGILGALAALAQPLLVGAILGATRTGKSVIEPATLLAALFVVDAVLSGIQGYVVGKTGEDIVLGVRRTLVGTILRMTVSQRDEHRTGDLISRVGADTTLLKTALAQSSTQVVVDLLTVLGAIVLMATIDPLLLLVTLACVLVATAAIVVVASRVQAATKEAQSRVGDLGSVLERALRAFRLVKIGGAEVREQQHISAQAEAAYRAGVRAARLRALVQPATTVTVQGSFVLVLGIGGARLAAGDLTLEELVAFLLYLLYLVTPLLSAFLSFTELQQGLAAVGRLEEVLAAQVENTTEATGPTRPSHISTPVGAAEPIGDESVVRFEKVSFGYGPERYVLRDVSFDIPAFGLTALVGPSGAGKTTIFSLLERFYGASSGRILLDGTEIDRLPLGELRGKIGYVEQDSPVMAGSIRENLLYANPSATEAQIDEVMELTNLGPFIERLPRGLETEVGEAGILLSGGERQRIAICRMLLLHPQLLLLDEITSQLDAANERALRGAIREASRRCAVVAIAHRFSTVAGADKIIVLDEGLVRAVGTHAKLMRSDALYRELVNTQLIDMDGLASER